MKNLFYSLIFLGCYVQAGEWSGYVATELRYFTESPLSAKQYEGSNFALSAQPEYYHEWDNGYQIFAFVPFIRVDQQDSERNHIDIRELTWVKAAQDWELRVGIRKVFWGVTESQHLVDIINQTDLVEHSDTEEKLGQPMINLALIRDWGMLDLFILPYFRERNFPSEEGRLLNAGIPIESEAYYESSAEEKHIDWAVRWEKMWGDWEIGLSHFSGTSREPDFLPNISASGQLSLTPYYAQINQTGLDLQVTKEDFLWKLEAISRDSKVGRFTALTAGLEYTFVGIFDSDADLGVLTEYSFDDRQDNAMTPFQNDVMLGMRLALNDVQSTELLAGVVSDMDNNSRFYLLEASRRLGDNWKLTLESYIYSNISRADVAYGFRQEDFIQLELAWYF
ncbi:MAG: hypothetical protein KAH84_10105 [Thiomargarita sp.]|nr:hypothetical protein [Thiomargarita sp.]